MTPPPSNAGTATAGRLRTGTAPRAPRRASGPAVRRRPAGRAGGSAAAPGRFEVFVRGLPDARWLDRLLRGRAWIALVACALMGIVFMQVSLLKLNSGISRAVTAADTLERQNSQLRADVSSLEGENRVQDAAARSGLVLPGRRRGDLPRRAPRQRRPRGERDPDPGRAARRPAGRPVARPHARLGDAGRVRDGDGRDDRRRARDDAPRPAPAARAPPRRPPRPPPAPRPREPPPRPARRAPPATTGTTATGTTGTTGTAGTTGTGTPGTSATAGTTGTTGTTGTAQPGPTASTGAGTSGRDQRDGRPRSAHGRLMAVIERRIGLLFAAFLALLVLAGARAAWLGVVRGDSLASAAASQQTQSLPLPAPRGTITDRNGVELAVSEPADDVSATPYLVKDPVRVAAKLAPLLDRSADDLTKLLARRDRGFVYLRRELPARAADRVAQARV